MSARLCPCTHTPVCVCVCVCVCVWCEVCEGSGVIGGSAPADCFVSWGAHSIGDPYSYTRLTAFNATDLLWEQISNKDSSVIDSWTVHQDKHGQFPIPPPPSN